MEDSSPQQAVLALAGAFSAEDDARAHPQACWEQISSNLHRVIEEPNQETWTSFASLIVDFPGRVANIYHAPFPAHYYPAISRLLVDSHWLELISPSARSRVQLLVSRLLTLGKEGPIAAAMAQQESTNALQELVLSVSPVEKLVLALLKVSAEAVTRLIPRASKAVQQAVETYVPLRMSVTTLGEAEQLCALISHYGSALPYIIREWSHPQFTRRLDEPRNRSLTLLLYASRTSLSTDYLPLLSEGIQARLACPSPEFHKSGLLIASLMYGPLGSELETSDRIECSLEDYLGSGTAPEGDSDDESDYESDEGSTHYLSDLSDSLDCDNKQRVARAISSAASLIRKDLDELDVETPRLADCLLKVENLFNLPDFEIARLDALVALTTLRPTLMLEILRRRLMEEGGSSKLLALSVLDRAAEALSTTEPRPAIAVRTSTNAKTRYFRSSRAQTGTSSPFSTHYTGFLQAVLDMYRKPASSEAFTAGLVTLVKFFGLVAHLKSQELTRAAVYALRYCVRTGLEREERECITAALMLLDTLLRQFVAATDWQEVLANTLQDYVQLREDLGSILEALSTLRLPGLEQVVTEIAAKVQVVLLDHASELD